MAVNPLPFQFLKRAATFERLDGMMRTEVLEARDRDLEDYLGSLDAKASAGTPGPEGPKGDKGDTGDTGAQGLPGAPGVVQSVVAGTGIAVNSADPANPVITNTGGGMDQATADARYVNIDGDTMTGDLVIANNPNTATNVLRFATTLRQMINLWGTTYGIGVQNSHLYLRSPNSFAWFVGGVHSNTAQDPGAGGTQVMRIDSTGALYLPGWMLLNKAASNVGLAGIELQSALGVMASTNDTAGNANVFCNKVGSANAAAQPYVAFRVGSAGTNVAGNINLIAGPGVQYAVSSDRRLKRLIGPVLSPVERVRRLKVWHFAWKADDFEQDGFVADEVQAVVPDAVSGEPDAVDAEGEIVPQQLDQARLVPLLTAALQEALDRIDLLEQRITALEAA